MSEPDHSPVILDGSSLTVPDLVRAARDPRVTVAIDPSARDRIKRGEEQVHRLVKKYEEAIRARESGRDPRLLADFPLVQDYGVTTGFGEFKDKPIDPSELQRLQENILLSHSSGVGETTDRNDPANYYPAEVVRAALVLRLNAFLKGHSGVRWSLVETIQKMVNRGIVPLVLLKGSVGSSGDLCPLAHLFVVLLGGGHYYLVRRSRDYAREARKLDLPDRETDDAAARQAKRAKLARDLGLRRESDLPLPGPKEGLALTNGATFSAAMLALAVHDGEALANAADVAVALSLEAVCGCARAFDPKIHEARGLTGQIDSAANIRLLLAGSRQIERAAAVQDAYSQRCAPAVHGASRDAIAHARIVASWEINAATDNPLFFPGEDGWDLTFEKNWRHRTPPFGAAEYRGEERASYSAGNFHGQPVALAADFLAIALAELADVSERRTQMLLDQNHNRRLPANLVPKGGVNSGFMLAQYCAAALVSENKVLAHPASVDSIPTSANSEDHVSMATLAARKLRSVLANVQAVLAIEMMVAAQAVEWRVAMGRGPEGEEGVDEKAKDHPVDRFERQKQAWARAEKEALEFKAATAASRRERISQALGRGTGPAYLAVRRAAAPLTHDRMLDEDIRGIRRILADRSLLQAVESAIQKPLRPISRLQEPKRPRTARR